MSTLDGGYMGSVASVLCASGVAPVASFYQKLRKTVQNQHSPWVVLTESRLDSKVQVQITENPFTLTQVIFSIHRRNSLPTSESRPVALFSASPRSLQQLEHTPVKTKMIVKFAKSRFSLSLVPCVYLSEDEYVSLFSNKTDITKKKGDWWSAPVGIW